MKLAILLIGTIITGLITLVDPGKNISGTWVMQGNPGICSPTVIRITMDKGVWVGKMDIPEQQVYDKEMYAVIVKGDSVFMHVSRSGNSIKAVLQSPDNLEGNIIAENGQSAVQFIKQ